MSTPRANASQDPSAHFPKWKIKLTNTTCFYKIIKLNLKIEILLLPSIKQLLDLSRIIKVSTLQKHSQLTSATAPTINLTKMLTMIEDSQPINQAFNAKRTQSRLTEMRNLMRTKPIKYHTAERIYFYKLWKKNYLRHRGSNRNSEFLLFRLTSLNWRIFLKPKRRMRYKFALLCKL